MITGSTIPSSWTNLRKEITRTEVLIADKRQTAEKVLSLFEVGDTAPTIVKSRLETLEGDSMEDQLTDRRGQPVISKCVWQE